MRLKLIILMVLGVFILSGCHKTIKLDNGDKYIGEVTKLGFGEMEGQGEYIYKNGDKYTGDFKQGEFLGKGVLTTKETNEKYDGNFGKEEFEGKYVVEDGDGNIVTNGDLKCDIDSLFESDENNTFNGSFKGKIYDENGNEEIDGTIEGDIPLNEYEDVSYEFSLDGKLYEEGDLVSEGNFKYKIKNGEILDLNGEGKFYDDNKLLIDGKIIGAIENEDKFDFDGKMYEDGKVFLDGKFKFDDLFFEGNGTMIDGVNKMVGDIYADDENDIFKIKGKMYESDKIFLDGDFTFKGESCTGTGKIYDIDTGEVVQEGDISY
ncbi:MAG: hypothetical protein ABF289_07000 [Clostridiales bacterium]